MSLGFFYPLCGIVIYRILYRIFAFNETKNSDYLR